MARVIRTDNGIPFATQAIRRISQLSVWWIKLGISPELNEPSHPEALGQKTPVSAYQPSPRPYPVKIPPIEYPAHFEVRCVSRNGGIRWKHSSATGPNNGWVNVSHVLAEEYVGLDEVDDGIWSVYFGPVPLGRFDERELRLYGDCGKCRTR